MEPKGNGSATLKNQEDELADFREFDFGILDNSNPVVNLQTTNPEGLDEVSNCRLILQQKDQPEIVTK